MKQTTFLFIVSLLAASTVNATTVTVTAQQGIGVSNLAGTVLSGTQVDLGHYDGSSFTPLTTSVATTGGALPAGLCGGAALLDSSSLSGVQPALRIVSDDGSSVIAYSTAWAFTSGDGTGTDTSTDYFYLEDVVSGGTLTGTGVVVASTGSQFDLNGTNNPTLGTASLAIGAFSATPTNLDSDNADNGVPAGDTTQNFTWGAPASGPTVTGYSFELKDDLNNIVDSGNTTSTSQTFTGLNPGSYTFEVTAIANNGVSEVATFDLVIDSGEVIPTMTEWGIMILVAALLLVAIRRLQEGAV